MFEKSLRPALLLYTIISQKLTLKDLGLNQFFQGLNDIWVKLNE